MFRFLQSGYKKFKEALSRTRSFLGSRLKALFGNPLDESTYEKLEEILYEADLGSSCAAEFTEHVRRFLRKNPEAPFDQITECLKQHALEILQAPPKIEIKIPPATGPLVILVVGINGSGKTTSIAKLAKKFLDEKKSVLLGAADTFRAAAVDQLSLWADRLKVDLVKGAYGADPSAVAFDALTAAKARGKDIVIIDTAGRLQNKTDLMQELEKILRVSKKVVPDAPHETLLVLDATTGQNGVDQAKVFHLFTPLSGIILAKLDGSAKGGVVIPIYQQFGIPVLWVGVGESIDDLIPFDSESYIQALFEDL